MHLFLKVNKKNEFFLLLWHAHQNIPVKAKVWLSYTVALEDSLSRPGDYKIGCTLTTGVSQIL
jgi:hypothetical protein